MQFRAALEGRRRQRLHRCTAVRGPLTCHKRVLPARAKRDCLPMVLDRGPVNRDALVCYTTRPFYCSASASLHDRFPFLPSTPLGRPSPPPGSATKPHERANGCRVTRKDGLA